MNLGRLAISLPVPLQGARRCVEIARRAENEWGYPAIWLAETNGPDSFALGGAIAAATSRVTLGTAIVPAYNRTPAVLAMSAATLAELSEGRFVLGLGSSSHAIIEDWNGLPFELPLTRLRETVTVVRQALAGAKTSFDGKTLRSRGFRLGNPPAQPVPIYLAALREKMLALAGEIGDGVIDRIAILGPAERCREQIAEFVAAGVTTPVISPLATEARAIEAVFEAFAPGGR